MIKTINKTITQIIELVGDDKKHFPLKAAMLQLQVVLHLSNEEESLLPRVTPVKSITIVIENYVFKYNPDDEFVNKLHAITSHLTIEEVEQFKSSTQRTREQFEKDVKRINRKISTDRSADGGYCNQYVEMAWGLQKKQYFRITNQALSRARLRAPYYVAKQDENGNLVFSEKPFAHKNFKSACKEAKRLCNKTGLHFTVLSTVYSFTHVGEQDNSVIADFIANQEPLGEEFAKVLHDNLFELYEEDNPLSAERKDSDKKD